MFDLIDPFLPVLISFLSFCLIFLFFALSLVLGWGVGGPSLRRGRPPCSWPCGPLDEEKRVVMIGRLLKKKKTATATVGAPPRPALERRGVTQPDGMGPETLTWLTDHACYVAQPRNTPCGTPCFKMMCLCCIICPLFYLFQFVAFLLGGGWAKCLSHGLFVFFFVLICYFRIFAYFLSYFEVLSWHFSFFVGP